MTTLTIDQLVQENEDLRRRLEEAEDAFRALRAGEVDAIFVDAGHEQVFTLETADKPYRLLVEQMPHAAATVTCAGAIITCNRRFADLLGRPVPSLLGKPLSGFLVRASRPLLKGLLRDGQTAAVRGEVELQRADSTRVPSCLGVSPVHAGALGLCLMVTDLTEQRHYEQLQRTQQALRESEERLAMKLADAKLLQSISAHLIQEDNVDALYEKIVEAACSLLRSDMASMQMLHPERNELELLAWMSPSATMNLQLSTSGTITRVPQRSASPQVVSESRRMLFQYAADSG